MKNISITPYGKNVFQDIRMTQTLNEYETPLGEIVACLCVQYELDNNVEYDDPTLICYQQLKDAKKLDKGHLKIKY